MYQQPPTEPQYPQGNPHYPQNPQAPVPQVSTVAGGGSCFGTGLIVLGVVGTLIVQTLILGIVFSGALATGIQEQEFIALGCMLTLGAIAVFILPGMFLVYRGTVKS